ncbi:MAG: hypothetical protein N2B57_07495 [Planctomycetales bacterium]
MFVTSPPSNTQSVAADDGPYLSGFLRFWPPQLISRFSGQSLNAPSTGKTDYTVSPPTDLRKGEEFTLHLRADAFT